MITTLFLPLANLMIGNSYFTFDVTGLSAATNDQIELIYPSWALFALSAIIALIAMIMHIQRNSTIRILRVVYISNLGYQTNR